MIKHSVMWNVKGASPVKKNAGIAKLRGAFEGIRGKILGLVYLEIGVNRSPVDYACDVVLYLTLSRMKRWTLTLRFRTTCRCAPSLKACALHVIRLTTETHERHSS